MNERLGSTRRRKRANSGRTEYNTPACVIECLDRMGGVTLDPCWNERSLVRPNAYWLECDDGLNRTWTGLVYVNPPYGRPLKQWAERINDHAVNYGGEVVTLVPNSTETRWYETLTANAQAECRIRGRLTFVGEKTGAFFGSVVVYHGHRVEMFEAAFAPLGRVVRLQP